MTKNRTIKVVDARTFGAGVARHLQDAEVGFGLGRTAVPEPRVVRFVVPDNGRGPKTDAPPAPHVPGKPELHMYDPRTGACPFIDQHGKRCTEDHRQGAVAAIDAEDDDVGDAPPSTQESASARESEPTPDRGRA